MKEQKLIESYRKFLIAEKRLKPNTAQQYCIILNDFFNHVFMRYGAAELSQIRQYHILNYTDPTLAYNKEKSRGQKTLSIARSVIVRFFSFLVYDEVISAEENPANDVGTMAVPPRKLPTILSQSEALALIDFSEKEPTIGVMIELLYASGIRVSELVSMTTNDVDFKHSYITVQSGKGDKQRIVPIHSQCLVKLQKYIQVDRQECKNYGATNILFLHPRSGRPYTRNLVCAIVKRIVNRAGIQKNITPHTFRHSFATHMYERGMDMGIIRVLLGHESIATTEFYVHTSTAELHKVLKAHHPCF